MPGGGPRRFSPALAFHAFTPFYDRANDLLGFGRPFTDRVVGALTLRGGEYLLDVGCGTGTLLADLRARYPRVKLVGIDVDVRALGIAREKTVNSGGVAVAQAAAQTLPFRDASFDVVVSTLIFHHLPTETKRQAVREIHRVLTPGGTFLLADFGKPQSLMQHVLLRLGSLFDGVGNMRANIAGHLPSLLQGGGFRVTESPPRYRAVQFLLATKVVDPSGPRLPV